MSAHERKRRKGPNYLPQLERDILEVIHTYVDIPAVQIAASLEQRGDQISALENKRHLPVW